MRYDKWFIDETLRLKDEAQKELIKVENDLHALELQSGYLDEKIRVLEYQLAEIVNTKLRLERLQKPNCWAMSE